jgi:SAM-dependent methyltransferase
MPTTEEIKTMVRDAYAKIAGQSRDENATSCCGAGGCSTTEFMMQGEDYSAMPGYNADADLGLGCGIPTQYSAIVHGETVLDLGSGAGNDVFIARAQTGPDGRVIGVDMTPAMIDKARANNAKLGYTNVEFRLGEIEHLPVASDEVNVVVSNCVLNLVPDKARAFAEIFRVLAPGGRFIISDVVLDGDLPEGLRRAAEMYAGCVSGAMARTEYLETARNAGFSEIRVLKDKEIVVPDEILASYLSPEELEQFGREGGAIHSITVRAEKPADVGCCGGACC